MGSINIVTSNDDDRQLETLHIRVYEHFGSCLACGIGVSWGEDVSPWDPL